MSSLAVSSSCVREGRRGQGGRECHHCHVGRVIVTACKEGRARRRCVQREVGKVDEGECGRCRLVLAYDSEGGRERHDTHHVTHAVYLDLWYMSDMDEETPLFSDIGEFLCKCGWSWSF